MHIPIQEIPNIEKLKKIIKKYFNYPLNNYKV